MKMLIIVTVLSFLFWVFNDRNRRAWLAQKIKNGIKGIVRLKMTIFLVVSLLICSVTTFYFVLVGLNYLGIKLIPEDIMKILGYDQGVWAVIFNVMMIFIMGFITWACGFALFVPAPKKEDEKLDGGEESEKKA